MTGTRPRVAVYRSMFLPRSETFVRDHVLLLPRYETQIVTRQIHPDPLPVPGKPAYRIAPGGLVGQLRRKLLLRRADGAVLERDVELTRALRTLRPDVVHAHFGVDGAEIVRAASKLGVPLVVTFHGYDATTYPAALARTVEGRLLLDRWEELAAAAGAIITVSRFLRSVLIERGIPEDKIHVIACGVQDPPGAPPPVPEVPSVLFVGRMVEKKGLADLIRALGGLGTRVRLDVVGDGPLRAEAESLALAMDVDASFHGTLAPPEVRDRMRAATMIAMPSKRAADGDCEGLPVTALEAGVNARPVVGYRHSGIPEAVLDGETGLLADEGDVAGLGACLAELIADPDRCNRMGAAARERIRAHFLSEGTLARVAEVYDRVRAGAATPVA